MFDCFLFQQLASGVEYLLKEYPKYVRVEDLPFDTVEDKVCLYFPFLKHNYVLVVND